MTKTFAEVAAWFQTNTRDSGEGFVTLTDDAPESLMVLVRDLHNGGSLLPCDWLYESIAETVNDLAEYEDPDEDSLHEVADGLVDVSTRARLQWLLDYYPESMELLAEVRTEMSYTDTEAEIGRAQYLVYHRIGSALLEWLREQNDEAEGEDAVRA